MRSIVWYRAILKNHTIFMFYIMQNMNVAVSSLKYGYDYNEFTKIFKGFHDIDNSFFPFGRRVECYMICKKWMCGSQPFLAEQEAQLTRVVANWSKQSATMFFSSVDLSDGCDVGTTLFQLQKFSIIERARLNRKSIDDIWLVRSTPPMYWLYSWTTVGQDNFSLSFDPFTFFSVYEQLCDHGNLTKKSQTYFPSILWQRN